MAGQTEGGRRRGMTPEEVDATPLWKIAAFLGSDIDRIEEARERLTVAHAAGKHEKLTAGCLLCYPETQGAPTGNVSSGRDIFAERVAAHARGEPEPEYEPPPVPAGVLALAGDGLLVPPDEE